MHEWIGKKAKDKITGFEGTVIGRSEYITGCDQFLVTPKVKADGEKKNGCWFDEQRLEIIKGKKVELDNSKGNGACGTAPVK